jgi:gliding motility-associated-like protein
VLQVVGFFNTYNWSDGSDQNSIQVTAPGPYGVTVTASNGCTGQKAVAVSVFTPVFSAGVNHPSCADLDDGRIVVSLIGGGQSPYLLSLDGGVFQPDTVFDHLPAGDYTVILQDAAGCEDSASLQLTAPPPFLVDIGPDVFLLPGDTLRLSAAATDSVSIWNWAPPQIFDCAACPMPLVRQPATTTISLTASNAGGCTATDVLQLTYDPEYRLYVPNAFSPDGDGENDFLEVFPGMGNWEVAEFVVFDRWGSLIFRSDTPFRHPQTLQWDGMSRGKQLMPGVYSWAARLRLAGGSEEIREGDVAIIR